MLIGGEDVQRHKPDPEGSCWRWRGWACRPVRRSTGDHAVDAQAAERAGVAFVGAVSGMTSFDGWARAGKQAVATHIGELDAIVQRMQCDPSEASG